MTKGELIETLKDFPDDMEIMLTGGDYIGNLQDVDGLFDFATDINEYILLVGAT